MEPVEWWSLPEATGIRVAALVEGGLAVRRRLADDAECSAPSFLDEDEVALFDVATGTVRGVRVGDRAPAGVEWFNRAEWEPTAEAIGWISSTR